MIFLFHSQNNLHKSFINQIKTVLKFDFFLGQSTCIRKKLNDLKKNNPLYSLNNHTFLTYDCIIYSTQRWTIYINLTMLTSGWRDSFPHSGLYLKHIYMYL